MRTALQTCSTLASGRCVCPVPSLVTPCCIWALELKSLLALELTTGVEAMNGKRVRAVHTPTTRGINNGQTLDSCKGNKKKSKQISNQIIIIHFFSIYEAVSIRVTAVQFMHTLLEIKLSLGQYPKVQKLIYLPLNGTYQYLYIIFLEVWQHILVRTLTNRMGVIPMPRCQTA